MVEVLPQGDGFGDVMLVPRRSRGITSRYGQEIDTSSVIARGLPPIKIPIISASMDTVTESAMAETMAFHGAVGVIHRFMTPEEQASQVRQVKERLRVMEDRPPIVSENTPIREVLALLGKRKRGYVIVAPSGEFNGLFSGLATSRDFAAAENPDVPVGLVMTPRAQVLTVPKGTTLEEAVKFMHRHRIEKVPVVDGEERLVGVYSLKDEELYRKFPNASLDNKGRLMVGAAIGVRESSDVWRAHLLVEEGVDFLVLDIAHGGLDYVQKMLKRLKYQEGIKVPIIAGNIASAEGVIYIKDSGADGVKVGVGPGFACSTRNVAGVGVPQITAIMEAKKALGNDKIPIISDGGVREPGDIAKALAAGADGVMVGSLFAGTDRSPGEITSQPDGRYVKVVRGMASTSAFAARQSLGDVGRNSDISYTPEGRVVLVPYRGNDSTVRTLFDLRNGLRSGMSYVGAHNLEELRERAIFIRVSSAGASEHRRPLFP